MTSFLNEIIHQPVRLRLLALLTAMPLRAQVEFATLKELFQLTDGNLGAHLHKLEEAGYVSLSKTFIDRKPFTSVSITSLGRAAFTEYKAALQTLLQEDTKSNDYSSVSLQEDQ